MAYSSYLITTPDFNMLPCLVTLEFGMCVNLKKVHESIGSLAGLVYLNLGSCVKLASLPKTISSLKTLKYLYLGMCRSLVKIPEDLFRMESLEELDISGVKVRTYHIRSICSVTFLPSRVEGQFVCCAFTIKRSLSSCLVS